MTETQVADTHNGLYVVNNGDTSLFEPMSAAGFEPYRDPLSHQLPNTTTNLLLVEGQLDPQTTPDWAEHLMEAAYPHPNQRLVSLPFAVHAAASLPRTPTVDGGEQCGFEVAASFFASGGRDVNTSCVERLEPPDFAGKTAATQQEGKQLLGTADIWG